MVATVERCRHCDSAATLRLHGYAESNGRVLEKDLNYYVCDECRPLACERIAERAAIGVFLFGVEKTWMEFRRWEQ